MYKYIKEVEQRLINTGHTVPEQRAAFRRRYSFSALPFEEQMAIWDHIWQHTKQHRVRAQAAFFCESICNDPSKLYASWETIKHWQEQINDWSLCDNLAKVYTKILELRPEEVYATLKQWNHSPDQWKRRQSVVSLLYFQSTKKVYLPYAMLIPLIDRLLLDEEYYVQKGVGWALKELHSVYPEPTYQYLLDHIGDISAIAFSPATEKITGTKKQVLKAKRRQT